MTALQPPWLGHNHGPVRRASEAPLAREFVFIRHGQTEWNLQRRMQGCGGDSPLTVAGRAQVAAHLQWLPEWAPALFLCSPLGRARESAAILEAGLGLAPRFEDALRERSMGAFEGLTQAQIATQYPDHHAARQRDPWGYRPPGGSEPGENYDDLLLRVRPLLDELRGHAGERVLVLSHGTLVRPMLGHLLGLERKLQLIIRAPNEIAYRVRLDPQPEVERLVQESQGTRVVPGLLVEGRR